MTAYYNEIDKHAAAWIRQLIKDGLIAPGDVDERDIKDVTPNDIRHYTQCHFFAGIGGWSRALRLAGWSDDRAVWTASCPCQPFSSAGKQRGTSDERHLWPVFFDLVKECRPVCIVGEQVASKAALEWFDGVSADLEGIDYPCGAIDLPAACVGAPHIRQRLFWLAYAGCGQLRIDGTAGNISGPSCGVSGEARQQRLRVDDRNGCTTGGLAHAEIGAGQRDGGGSSGVEGQIRRQQCVELADSGATCGLAHAEHVGHDRSRGAEAIKDSDGKNGRVYRGGARGLGDTINTEPQGHGRPVNEHDQAGRQGTQRHGSEAGFWSDYQLVPCGDGKARRIEPGLAPLVDGLPRGVVPGGDPRSQEYAQATAEARVMRLRGYGNAINPIVAAEFIKAYLETGGQP